MPTLADYTTRAHELVALATATWSKRRPLNEGRDDGIETEAFRYMRASSLSFIRTVYGEEHPHYRDFNTKTAHGWDYEVKYAIGILKAVRDELADGWLVTTRAIVSAEVFSDFLEMAEHFLEEGYKDPAAVMVGGVLEEHLRQLSAKHGLPIAEADKNGKMVPRKAARLNDELKKVGAYNAIDHSGVNGWLAVRNAAAHGKHAEYSEDQVRIMRDSVTSFIGRTPL